MCKEHEEMKRRLTSIEKMLLRFEAEIFPRLRKTELAIATANGAKIGIISTVSVLWILIMAGVGAAWKWAHT